MTSLWAYLDGSSSPAEDDSAMVLPLNLLKYPSRPSPPQRRSSSSSALQEALRLNPFAGRRDAGKSNLQDQNFERQRRELNDDLISLTKIFPNIQCEVLREILLKFDGNSRLHTCIGQLLRHQTQWVKGRWHTPPRNIDENVPLESSFRSAEYKSATQRLLSQEFKYLSRSTIEGVLAENNYSYIGARPTLSDLSNRTWRASLGSLNIFRKRREIDVAPAELLQKYRTTEGSLDTSSHELDIELQQLFLEPTTQKQRRRQEEEDRRLADEINEAEAREMKALYECECCCGETTFEKLSSCSTNAHVFCIDCIQRTVNEALFGQGWARSVDQDHGALRCLAPLADAACDGCISRSTVRHVLLATKAGSETWTRFEDRLAEDSLLKSHLKLIRCPFCPYAEEDPNYRSANTPAPYWRLKPIKSLTTLISLVVLIDLLPLLILLVLLFASLRVVRPFQLFHTSLIHLAMRCRSPRFRCRNPGCSRVSCLKCHKAWHDPHTCHEPLLISLRTTVEAARTGAIKRTCPRCGLSFVKSSGCNKLTCVCGYSMCYLCRTALGAPSIFENPRARRPVIDVQGYRHFCEHFRVNPGKPCTECDKCDLYKNENEDLIVRRAGEVAEREWRIKEGLVGVDDLCDFPDHRKEEWLRTSISKGWTSQRVVDWIAGHFIEVDYWQRCLARRAGVLFLMIPRFWKERNVGIDRVMIGNESQDVKLGVQIYRQNSALVAEPQCSIQR